MTERGAREQSSAVAALDAAPTTPAAEADAQSIYRQELSWLWQVLARLRVRDADLEDAAHDVFIVLHRRLNDWDRTRPLRPWLFGIAFRVAVARRRRASVRHERPFEDHHEPVDERLRPDTLALQQASDAAAKQLVLIGLDALDDDKRAIFVLHELEGVAVVDCVPILNAPLNTLYSRLRLARARFAAAVRAAHASQRGNE